MDASPGPKKVEEVIEATFVRMAIILTYSNSPRRKALFDEGKVLQKNRIVRYGKYRAVDSSEQGRCESLWKAVLDSLAEEAVGKEGLLSFTVEEGKKAKDVLWIQGDVGGRRRERVCCGGRIEGRQHKWRTLASPELCGFWGGRRHVRRKEVDHTCWR